MADGTHKTALAMMIFGKSGKDMIPILNQGAEGIRQQAEQMQRLGILIDEDVVKSVGVFTDRLDVLKMMGSGLSQRILGELTPALDNLVKSFIESDETGKQLKHTADVIATGFKLMATTALVIVGVFDIVGTTIGNLIGWFNTLGTQGTNSLDDLGLSMKDLGMESVKTAGAIAAIDNPDILPDLEKKLSGYVTKIAAFWGEVDRTATPMKRTTDFAPTISSDKAVKDAEDQAAKILKIQQDANMAMSKHRQDAMKEYEKLLGDEIDFASTENERQINAIIKQEQDKLSKINVMLQEETISWEQYERAKVNITSNAAKAILDKNVENANKIAGINYQLVDGIIGMETTAFNLKMEQIEAQKNKYIKDGGDIVHAAKWAANEQMKAMIKLGKTGDSVSGGMSAAWKQLYLDQVRLGQAAFDVTTGTYKQIESAWSDTIYDVITGDINNIQDVWESAWKGMLKTVTSYAAKISMKYLLNMSGIGKLFEAGSGVVGSEAEIASNELLSASQAALTATTIALTASQAALAATTAAGDAAAISLSLSMDVVTASSIATDAALIAQTATVITLTAAYTALAVAMAMAGMPGGGGGGLMSFFHEGGIVGETTVPKRELPAATFIGAPRLHSGLAGDEFPAILQRGETVIPKGKRMATTYHITIPITVKGSVVTEQDLARKLVPKINKAIREGAH
jgi:hypothetical protein